MSITCGAALYGPPDIDSLESSINQLPSFQVPHKKLQKKTYNPIDNQPKSESKIWKSEFLI